MKKREDWVSWMEGMPAEGRLTFTIRDAIAKANGNQEAARKAVLRARQDGRVVCIRKGLYSWVPPEYRNDGIPPFFWIVHEWMKCARAQYYVGMLSAADLLGVSPQAPMEYQVMVDRQLRTARYGKRRVTFVLRSHWPDKSLLVRKSAYQDSFWVSGPELTLIDMVKFPQHAAGWDNIATLTRILGPQVGTRELASALVLEEMPIRQRLGWILNHVGYPRLAKAVIPLLSKGRLQSVPLELGGPPGGILDDRFKVRINYRPEAEA